MSLRKLMTAGIIAISCFASQANAWDGSKYGKITGIDTTGGQNFAFRVYMDGTPMCGTTEAWAYMNRDWDNYDATAALLTSAYLTGKPVVLYLTKVDSYCKIDYAAFR